MKTYVLTVSQKFPKYWLCVCYFGLQTLAFKDEFYSQNNSTKPLLVAGAVN